MKSSEFKKIIKESLREVIKEDRESFKNEIKEFITESINKINNITPKNNITENVQNIKTTTDMFREEMNNTVLKNILNDMKSNKYESPFIGEFKPQDNGELGNGEISLNQIKGLIK